MLPKINNNSNHIGTEQILKSETIKKDCKTDKDPSDTDSICPFDNSSIPPECTIAQNFSFPAGKPCLLIKLNRVSSKGDILPRSLSKI